MRVIDHRRHEFPIIRLAGQRRWRLFEIGVDVYEPGALQTVRGDFGGRRTPMALANLRRKA